MKGFTLIELLIVIAIIAIIASVVFVALDPLTRFQDSRNSVRWQDIRAIIEAIKIDQIDNGGDYYTSIDVLNNNVVNMITDGPASSGCDDQNDYCDINVDGDASCVDLAPLVTQGYLGDVPVSPNGEGVWTENVTGYTLEKKANGIIVIRACESENSNSIWISK